MILRIKLQTYVTLNLSEGRVSNSTCIPKRQKLKKNLLVGGGGGGEPNPLVLRPLLAYCTSPGCWWMRGVEQSVECLTGKYSEKACPTAALSTTNPSWPDPGSNQGRRAGKPEPPELRHGLKHLGPWYSTNKIIGRKLVSLRRIWRHSQLQMSAATSESNYTGLAIPTERLPLVGKVSANFCG
jgi:hypothetical protein